MAVGLPYLQLPDDLSSPAESPPRLSHLFDGTKLGTHTTGPHPCD
jgi:hypothetical protein